MVECGSVFSTGETVRGFGYNEPMHRSLIIALLCLTSLPALAGLFKVGVSREKQVGGQAAAQIENSPDVIVLRGPAHELINAIGQKLVKALGSSDFEFRFNLIDLESKGEREKIINAFCLPAGHIYLFRDMQEVIATEDQLAAVLAHEMIHAADHHWARQQSSDWDRGLLLLGLGLSGAGGSTLARTADIASFAMMKRFSRKHEQSADDQGIALMARAGFDPQGMVAMLEALAKLTKDAPRLLAWESDHPQLSLRVERAKRHAAEVKNAGKPGGTGDLTRPSSASPATYARPRRG